jgi:hypothetical protein
VVKAEAGCSKWMRCVAAGLYFLLSCGMQMQTLCRVSAIESEAAQLRSITSQAICSADFICSSATLEFCGKFVQVFEKKHMEGGGRRRMVSFFVTTFVL